MPADQKKRRRPRGSAWHWRQTDCWYFTPPGTRRRVPLKDEAGRRIRGAGNRQAAELALARIKVARQWRPEADEVTADEWLTARACSEYVQHCRSRAEHGAMNPEYSRAVDRTLNHFCEYCGAMPISQLTKGHVQHWVESQESWRSPVTRRNAMTIVLSAMNHARDMHDVPHRLKGLKKPPSQPRLLSFSEEDEAAIYEAADDAFGDFLFAAINTGLRPFCELARLTAEDVEETPRGMMWRVYSSKTKKTRKIPVRAEVAERTRTLMQTAPRRSGLPIFRNAKGGPWKKANCVNRFIRIREKLGWDEDPIRCRYSSYTCRHTFAHRMLAGYWNDGVGCSIETLAELIGDTPKVAFDHYGREWGQRYQDPLWAALGVEEPG